MKLIVKFGNLKERYGFGFDLSEELYDSYGIVPKKVRGGIIFDLPKEKNKGDNQESFILPREFVGSKIYIECSEYGGATNPGAGQGNIICGLSGRALTPYYRFKINISNDNSNQVIQARFSVPWSVVSISAMSQDNRVLVRRHDVLLEEGRVIFKKTILWEGFPGIKEAVCPICGKYFFESIPIFHLKDNKDCWGKPSLRKLLIPNEIYKYHDAILAAISKSKCVNCRCCHYVASFDF